jgi:hypothetical protein
MVPSHQACEKGGGAEEQYTVQYIRYPKDTYQRNVVKYLQKKLYNIILTQ